MNSPHDDDDYVGIPMKLGMAHGETIDTQLTCAKCGSNVFQVFIGHYCLCTRCVSCGHDATAYDG